VITVSTFCKVHSSFWRDLTPTMDVFVRRLNLGQYERDFPELRASTSPTRRGLINETAFTVFCQQVRRNVGWPQPRLTTEDVRQGLAEVHSRTYHRELRVQAGDSDNLTEDELFDVEEQRNRLARMFCFEGRVSSLVIEPSFPGCGMIDSGTGDLISSNALFEVKAGDRSFRSVDVRQLIIYSALNYISRRYQIEKLGLFNPRVGISATISVDDLCAEISSKKSSELFSEIVAAISSGDISR
jgi:hypothetical protein